MVVAELEAVGGVDSIINLSKSDMKDIFSIKQYSRVIYNCSGSVFLACGRVCFILFIAETISLFHETSSYASVCKDKEKLVCIAMH